MEEEDFIKDNVEEIDAVEKEEKNIHNDNNVDEIFENDKSFKKRIILIVSTILFVILMKISRLVICLMQRKKLLLK